MKIANRLFLFLLIVILLQSCYDDKSRKSYDDTFDVCGGKYFVEKFTVFGNGAFGSDQKSNYLTDSSTFRIFVGTFDEGHEVYNYSCAGDSIYIVKYNRELVSTNPSKIKATVIYKLAFNLKELAIKYPYK